MSECGCGCKTGVKCIKAQATPEAPAWLDKPDADGWWWRVWIGSNPSQKAVLYRLAADEWECYGHWTYRQPGAFERWQRIPEPTPPPAPLPKSRTVTLTAKVHANRLMPGSYYEAFYLDGKETSLFRHGTMTGPKEACLKSAREKSGCEPEVEGEA